MIRRLSAGVLLAVAALPVVAGEPSPESLMEAGHWKRLRAIAESRLASHSDDAQAASVLSRVKMVFGDLDAALRLAEKAVAIDGQNPNYHYQLAAVNCQLAQRTSMFKALGFARRCKKEIETALSLDSKQVKVHWALMEFYAEAPGIAGGDKKKARAEAEGIAQLDAARGYLAHAALAEREKEKDQAKLEELYRKAVEAAPRSYEAQTSLAFFYGSDAQKKYDLAEKHAHEALKLDPSRAGAYVSLAQLYAQQERWRDLDGLLAQAEKNVPDDFNPCYQAARTLVTEGRDLPRAEGYFRRYLSQEAEGNTPHWAAAHWRLGQVLEKQGRKAEAIAELETALRLDPNFEPAKKELKRLR